MTSELERIKILEGKISHIVNYVNNLTSENKKLKQQVKELKSEKRNFEEQIKKTGKFSEEIKKYESEREILKDKIEAIINQIDEIGI